MINQTQHIIEDVREERTALASSFAECLESIPNLQIYSHDEGIYWTAWDMGTKYQGAYNVDRALVDIAIEEFNRSSK